ncbi:MAG: DUF4198 domain-containing protein [Gammaproteobacteria bacterium]
MAHDMWIEPGRFDLGAGDSTTLTLRIGERFKGDTVPNVPEWYHRFDVSEGGDTRAVDGALGDDPAGRLTARGDGPIMVVYQSRPDFVEMKGAKFNSYLETEGMTASARAQGWSGEPEAKVGEFYARCLKLLVNLPSGELDPALTRARCPIDLMVTRLGEGHSEVLLEFQGQPLADALVVAYRREAPTEEVRVRTDESGVAALMLREPGDWLLTAVHITARVDGRAQWLSHWAAVHLRLLR